MMLHPTGSANDIIRLHFDGLAKAQDIHILLDADNINIAVDEMISVEGIQRTEGTGQIGISNRAMAILINDKYASVAFSGKGTGFIAFYDHDNFKVLTQGRYYLQRDNQFIAEERVVLSSIPENNEFLINKIGEFQAILKKHNVKELNKMIRDDTDKMLGDLNDVEERAVMLELRKDLANNVWLGEKVVMERIVEIYKRFLSPNVSKFSDSILEKKSEISEHKKRLESITKTEKAADLEWKEKYFSLKEKIAKLEKSNTKKKKGKEDPSLYKYIEKLEELEASAPESYKILIEVEKLTKELNELRRKVSKEKNEDKKKALQKELGDLDQKRKDLEALIPEEELWKRKIQALEKEVTKFETNLSVEKKNVEQKVKKSLEKSKLLKKIRELDKELTHWSHDNCAEPHATTLFARSREAFLDKPFGGTMKFLATYKNLDLEGGLESFPRCDNCIISTESIPSVITDHSWLVVMENLRAQLDIYTTKLNHPKNIPHLFVPMTNSSLKAKNSSSIRGKRSVFVGQGEVETIPNPRTRSSKLTSISNQLSKESIIDINKKVTNSATRTSSWINDLFGWIRSSVSGLLSSEPALPRKTSSTPTPISQVDAPVDVNGTIMLLDVLVRKFTGKKYISEVDQSIPLLEARGYALNITKGFEKVVEQAGLKSGVSMHRLNIDYMGMQKEITRKVMSGKFNEISGILSSYLEKACPSREAGCLGKLSSKKFDKFMVEFNSRLNVVLNRSIQRILHNGDGRLEVDGAKQMNLEPQSYLSNASVQDHSKDKVSTCLSEIGVTKLGGNLNR
ncbi:latrotoxin-related protein [Wolbachia endosymbiont (group B) of Leptidea sinapis]|uniref:latrotoxin-related protein n=1 Tax=Wolbachia endosymbiont (group B) of Leptidea sinapis TaxID=2954026 RepID=UPI00221E855F|nr:latrotoxin-related protein [Wolbachia endosymbiont (group B) of Leptidea sinapis]